MKIVAPIIPLKNVIERPLQSRKFNFNDICVFVALGFMLDDDTWHNGQMALQPATQYEFDSQSKVCEEFKWWRWHYSPRDISLRQTTEEFSHIFERIVREHTDGKSVILPLSGGLDSRTLAGALIGRKDVMTYSYEYPGGIPESSYGRVIAETRGFSFRAFSVPQGYLWQVIDRLAQINGCYAEFTHARQMAFLDEYYNMGELFLLGHWGDVLFDDMGVPDDLPFDHQVDEVLKKVLKKGGMELGHALWQAWGLTGDFSGYLRARIKELLRAIDIDNANARIRAFKSMYWAPRWTSVNLQVFAAARPIVLPYYHDDMCRFICTVPERYLTGRQIQIEYLKMVAPELARIPWQAERPFNLYNYHWNKTPWNLPFRAWDKVKRTLQYATGKPLIQRNWELQFLGEDNDRQLRKHLFDNPAFAGFVPQDLVREFYRKFREVDAVQYAHPLSMLLTMSVFCRQQEGKSLLNA